MEVEMEKLDRIKLTPDLSWAPVIQGTRITSVSFSNCCTVVDRLRMFIQIYPELEVADVPGGNEVAAWMVSDSVFRDASA